MGVSESMTLVNPLGVEAEDGPRESGHRGPDPRGRSRRSPERGVSWGFSGVEKWKRAVTICRMSSSSQLGGGPEE